MSEGQLTNSYLGQLFRQLCSAEIHHMDKPSSRIFSIIDDVAHHLGHTICDL